MMLIENPAHGVAFPAALAAAWLIAGCNIATLAAERIVCRGQQVSDIEIILNDHSAFHRRMDCLSGDFVTDMFPSCFPRGAFALFAPTGDGELVGIANTPRQYEGHIGMIGRIVVDRTRIKASGGSMQINGYREDWAFTLDRLTGHGNLSIRGEPARAYACRATKL